MLNTTNATEVFVNRFKFAKLVDKILNLPEENITIHHAKAIDAVKRLNEFTGRIGEYLKQTNTSSFSVNLTQFALHLSMQNKTDKEIVASNTSRNMHLDVNDEYDLPTSVYNDTNCLGQTHLPNSSFHNASNNLLYALAYNHSKVFPVSRTFKVVSIMLSVAIDGYKTRSMGDPIDIRFKRRGDEKGTISCVS